MPIEASEVVQEAHLGQPQRIVEQVEREDRGEAQQRHDLEPLAPHRLVDGGELRVAGDPPLDRPAREVARDQERRRGAESGADQGVDRPLGEAEDGAGGERQQRAGDERDGRHGVAEDEDDRPPHAQALHPLREARHVGPACRPARNRPARTASADDDIEDEFAAGSRGWGGCIAGCVHEGLLSLLRELYVGNGGAGWPLATSMPGT